MRQLAHKLRDGTMEVAEVPIPVVRSNGLLVQNAYSVISAGTEGSTVKAARKGLLGKAKERPQQVRQMIELMSQAGPVQAYRTLTKKLDSYSPLGYSSAGFVVGVGDGVSGFAIGDKVACAGAGASHAEIVSVPRGLCVRLPQDADLGRAAYNTLGAIALQGVRQADLRLGESCVVIGLGLLGQLTCLLLRSAGVKVLGVDVDTYMVELARKHAADGAWLRSEIGLAEKVDEFTGGIGVDGVIITAGTSSTDPINFAGRILRQKGRVVILGNVPTGFDREPHFYRKELDLRMSCSYGPGRYDPVYEDKGIDYPVGYVRWTEHRNMEAFQEFVHSKKVDIGYLTTHVFKFDDAIKAYDLLMQKTEQHLGIVLEYDAAPIVSEPIRPRKAAGTGGVGEVNVAFIGAGSYAMSHLLPNLPTEGWVRRRGVMTASGLNSRTVVDRFGFEYCTSNEDEMFSDEQVNTVFVAARHDTHAKYVVGALESGKAVFVEKPLCLDVKELDGIRAAMRKATRPLMVGFNRRFAPLVQLVRERIGTGPMSMVYRINAGQLSPDSWIRDSDASGGRIVGEVCHFIDLLTFINGSRPERIQAFGAPDAMGGGGGASVNVGFENGSIGSVAYFTSGSKRVPKEYLEVYRGGSTAILRDFREAEILDGTHRTKRRLLFQDKGQANMITAFLEAVRNGGDSPIPFGDIEAVTLATFRAAESLRVGSVLAVGSGESVG